MEAKNEKKNYEELKKTLIGKIGKEEIEIAEFLVCISELYKTQYGVFDALHDFVHYANERAPSDSIDEMNLSLSSAHGAGLNVGKAFASLAAYISDDDEIAFNGEDLMEAIYNLMNEQTRRKQFESEE
jgi:hypothetical protein